MPATQHRRCAGLAPLLPPALPPSGTLVQHLQPQATLYASASVVLMNCDYCFLLLTTEPNVLLALLLHNAQSPHQGRPWPAVRVAHHPLQAAPPCYHPDPRASYVGWPRDTRLSSCGKAAAATTHGAIARSSPSAGRHPCAAPESHARPGMPAPLPPPAVHPAHPAGPHPPPCNPHPAPAQPPHASQCPPAPAQRISSP